MDRTPGPHNNELLNEDSTNREHHRVEHHQQRSQGSYYAARDHERDAEEILIQNLPEQRTSLVMDYTPLRGGGADSSSEKKLNCPLRSKSHSKSRRTTVAAGPYMGEGST